VIGKEGERITEEMLPAIQSLNRSNIFIAPYVTNEVEYLSADAEDKFVIAQANSELNQYDEFVEPMVSCRFRGDFITSGIDGVNYMDVAPNQVVGISAALIPFLEHDDANRALMGAICSVRQCSAQDGCPLYWDRDGI